MRRSRANPSTREMIVTVAMTLIFFRLFDKGARGKKGIDRESPAREAQRREPFPVNYGLVTTFNWSPSIVMRLTLPHASWISSVILSSASNFPVT